MLNVECFHHHFPYFSLLPSPRHCEGELFFTVRKFFTDFLPHCGNNPRHMAQRTSQSKSMEGLSSRLFCNDVSDYRCRDIRNKNIRRVRDNDVNWNVRNRNEIIDYINRMRFLTTISD